MIVAIIKRFLTEKVQLFMIHPVKPKCILMDMSEWRSPTKRGFYLMKPKPHPVAQNPFEHVH